MSMQNDSKSFALTWTVVVLLIACMVVCIARNPNLIVLPWVLDVSSALRHSADFPTTTGGSQLP